MRDSLVWLSSFCWEEKYRQRTHHLVHHLSKVHRVLFVETRFSVYAKLRVLISDPKRFFAGGISRVDGNLHVLSIYSLFPRRLSAYLPILNWMNGRIIAARTRDWKTRIGLGEFIAGTCSPYHYGHAIGRLGAKLTFFDCIDEHSEFRFAPPWSIGIEKNLIAGVDHVFATSRHLQRSRSGLCGKAVKYLPNAVDSRFFEVAPGPSNPPHGERPPVIGFAGYFGEWVDFDLLDFLMHRLAAFRFVLAGEGGIRGNWRIRKLARTHRNCEWKGLVPYHAVPALVAGFDVAIIPFRKSRLVEGVNPIKLFEYASLGVPIVSTRWKEMEQYARPFPASIRLASDPPEFLEQIAAGLAVGNQPRLREFARRQTWERRAEEMSRILAAPSPEAQPSAYFQSAGSTYR